MEYPSNENAGNIWILDGDNYCLVNEAGVLISKHRTIKSLADAISENFVGWQRIYDVNENQRSVFGAFSIGEQRLIELEILTEIGAIDMESLSSGDGE